MRGPFLLSLALTSAAIAGPALVPLGTPPLISLYTETGAMLAWGLWLAWLWPRVPALGLPEFRQDHAGLVAVLVVLGLLIGEVAASVGLAGLPSAIGLRNVAVLASAGVTLLVGARLAATAGAPAADALGRTALLGFLLAGVGSAVLAVLQYLGVDGFWEPLGKDGRAGAHLGQPNLLGTQLLWAFVALAALRATGHIRRSPAIFCAALLVVALAASASRTAAVSSGVLVAWAMLDRRLGRDARLLLVAAPVTLALMWLALSLWQYHGGPSFSGPGLLHKADPTSSRWRLWQQCALLVAGNPWLGVGWGQFNFAWTLTPMPGLPRTAGYTFTHAHNLFVQWAVELGVPLTLVLTGLLAFAVLVAVRDIHRAAADGPVLRRAALAIVMIVLVHSQLEFPLWYANFLLPTAFMLGIALTAPSRSAESTTRRSESAVAPLLMALAATFAIYDYQAAANVYAPPPDAAPLEQRIARARNSILFGHLADRFAGTMAHSDARRLEPFQRTVFEILDWRLLASWAQTYAERGQYERARFLAARLREFDGPGARLYFSVCKTDPQRFQCVANRDPLTFRDFR